MDENTLLDRLYIRKDKAKVSNRPYFPCDNIVEEGVRYEFIITLGCILFAVQGLEPTVHQIQPIEGWTRPIVSNFN